MNIDPDNIINRLTGFYFDTWEGRYLLLLLVLLATTILASLAAETRALANQWDDDDERARAPLGIPTPKPHQNRRDYARIRAWQTRRRRKHVPTLSSTESVP